MYAAQPVQSWASRRGLVVVAAMAWAVRLGAEEEMLRIKHAPKPEYPARAMAEGLGLGEVRVLLEIDEFGQVDDALVIAHTHEVFANTLLNAVKDWRFEPARRNGLPLRTILQVEYAFRVGTEGMVFVDRKGPASNMSRTVTAGSRWAFELCRADELDERLRPIERVAPAYPKALKEGGTGGRVLVEFYVDGKGETRFPQVIAAVHPVLDAAALAAVRQWRFAPPRRRGRDALVKVTQAFEFVPEAKPGAQSGAP